MPAETFVSILHMLGECGGKHKSIECVMHSAAGLVRAKNGLAQLRISRSDTMHKRRQTSDLGQDNEQDINPSAAERKTTDAWRRN